ncbi:hypothetical protein GCM10023339_19380 [Alloalcanivorax gelatiniphagus]
MSFEIPTEFTEAGLARLREEHAERARRADAAGDRIQAIVAVGRSSRGLVEVTVDGSAVVTDIRFSDGAASSHALLGQMVKQAHDRAVADWHRQVREITEHELADDDRLRTRIQAQSDADFHAHVDLRSLDEDQDWEARAKGY